MSIASLGSVPSDVSADNPLAVLGAVRALKQLKQEGQATQTLIASASPGDGRGRYVNTMA